MPHSRSFSVRVTGWVWSSPMAGSVAEKLAVKETEVKGFTDLKAAKEAVKSCGSTIRHAQARTRPHFAAQGP